MLRTIYFPFKMSVPYFKDNCIKDNFYKPDIYIHYVVCFQTFIKEAIGGGGTVSRNTENFNLNIIP